MKVKDAIAYFEDAIREGDEIIADCSPALQAELTKQKGHFVVALAALREQEQREQGNIDYAGLVKDLNIGPDLINRYRRERRC